MTVTKPALPRRLRNLLTLDDFQDAARRHLPRPLYGYVSGYAERGRGGDATREAFAEYDFVPQVLTDVSGRDLSVELMGRRYDLPFGIPPMGLSAAIAYDGDVALGRAAAEAGVPFVLSASSLIPMERVADEGQARWYQAYLPGEEDRILSLVERVEAAGFDTFVLTADVPVAANRENNVRNGFDIPLKPSPSLAWQGVTHPRWLAGTGLRTVRRHGMPHFENMDAFRGPPILSRHLKRAIGKRDQLAWEHLELIRKRWSGTLVVKGLVSPDDAVRAKECGADGIILSNHGGRQLDGVAAPLRMLPEVRRRVGDEFAVMLDSGIRRGTDVLKALALGADFVFAGRPFLYAAALGGEAGVRHAISILATEVDRNLALVGARRIADLGPHHLIRHGGAG